ncbi:hypothetical protein HO173_010424 [Letharia columbiana]|uniref:Myb-like domain-containing protein n=1 Tax=Letharia columbiana TaxID=112416 RepID=A0A8H6FMI6_9LECA|nr:uncharacterized protein HO173_010424 [Letharia columbiana]KAF6231281.1 hypothetical protein HO173_010424 [Letharia columbiana]
MPWDDVREKRLLIELITITNPAVTRSTWDTIAAVMGDGLTGEACRQKFQSIKRTVKPANSTTTTPDGTTASKAAKATKPKPSTSSGTATKTRKRKANVRRRRRRRRRRRSEPLHANGAEEDEVGKEVSTTPLLEWRSDRRWLALGYRWALWKPGNRLKAGDDLDRCTP